MASNKEILGVAAEQGKTVLVQLPDGSFVKTTPVEAKAFVETEKKVDPLAYALRRFAERKKQEEAEFKKLELGCSYTGGKEVITKILGRSTQR